MREIKKKIWQVSFPKQRKQISPKVYKVKYEFTSYRFSTAITQKATAKYAVCHTMIQEESIAY